MSNLAMPDNAIHIIDTCVLVNIQDEHQDSEEIWSAIVREIEADRLKTIRHVWDELDSRFAAIAARLKPLKSQFLIGDALLYGADTVAELRAIIRDHPGLFNVYGNGNPADPFLIAAAKIMSAIVVTDERIAGPKHKRKIPFVCTGRNVGCISRLPYLKLIGCNV